ncbi:MAG: hypothetical protein LUE17_03365, partial [Planctomycetaceae bacterium]|nr:hypothetical protein [Planctomycetaceae bacterium]
MKRIGLAMVAIFALVGGIAFAEDMDVRALQAKLAAQEARLNDLQAKMYGAACDEGTVADGITSLRKNAVVTIGGELNTRYFYRKGEIKSQYSRNPASKYGEGQRTDGREKVMDNKRGDMKISDAKLEAKIDVNEYFDAYLKMDLQDLDKGSVSGIAENYWVRWKNVCNTGFGLLVGRDDLKFCGVTPYGAIGSFVKNYDGGGDVLDGFGTLYDSIGDDNNAFQGGEGMFAHGNMVPAHTIWDHSRVTQFNPYWETQDGSFRAEMSLIQAIDTINGNQDSRISDDGRRYRSVNYGFGSGTLRLTWKPVEGLNLVASAMNLHAKNGAGRWTSWRRGTNWEADGAPLLFNGQRAATDDNNTSVNFAFEYRPCFFNRLNIWATYTHGWNEAWIKDMDSDVLSYGFGFDITEQLTFFAQGDYMKVKNDQAQIWHKATGWAGYAGLIYTLPYGVNLEAGYRHEQFTYKERAGNKHTQAKDDTIYAHLAF